MAASVKKPSAAVALPSGLRLQQRRKPPAGLGVGAIMVLGVALGAALWGAPLNLVLGTLAALLAIGAAVYSPALGLAVLAVSYPFDLTTYAGPLKLTTSEALILILAIVMLGRHLLRNPPPILRTSLDLPVVLFGVATLLSLFGMGGFLSDQLVALVKAAGGFLLFFLVTQSLRQTREVWLIIMASLAAGLLLAAVTIVPIIQGSASISEQNRAAGNLMDANLFAGYLVILIPLTLAAGVAIQRRWALILAGLGMLVFGAALAATLSRGGWLGLLVGVLALAALLPAYRRVVVGAAAAVIFILLIAGLAGPVASRLGSGAGSSPVETFQARLPIWSAGIGMWLSHPLFGIGLNNFGNYIGAYNPELDVNQAHDLLLNVLVERGILGLITFLVFLVALFATLGRTLAKTGGATNRLLVAGIMASFAAFLADSLFDAAYYDYKILLLFWLLAGIAASLPRLLRPPEFV